MYRLIRAVTVVKKLLQGLISRKDFLQLMEDLQNPQRDPPSTHKKGFFEETLRI